MRGAVGQQYWMTSLVSKTPLPPWGNPDVSQNALEGRSSGATSVRRCHSVHAAAQPADPIPTNPEAGRPGVSRPDRRLIRRPEFRIPQKTEWCDTAAAACCDTPPHLRSTGVGSGRNSSSELHSIGVRLQLLRTSPFAIRNNGAAAFVNALARCSSARPSVF
jgi:hypothetical protein